MSVRKSSRRGRKSSNRSDSFLDKRLRAVQREKLIPIIGDAIRNVHIFDPEDDTIQGIKPLLREEFNQYFNDGDDSAEIDLDLDGFNVTEELAQLWALRVEYPLADRFRIARVAQYHRLTDEDASKEDYLDFLKETLLRIAEMRAIESENAEEVAYIRQLRHEDSLSFADVVTELDLPMFADNRVDSLSILAKLPIKIYLTTSYHDFIERELEAAGKRPQSRLCFWYPGANSVKPEHRPDPDFIPDVNNPVVYHLFGMEQYPESLVLSEDDYLDFLWALARDIPGDSGERIIPPYLAAELSNASLLLLGYRIEDWDLRILFRGLLTPGLSYVQRRLPSTAIQIDVEEQHLFDGNDEDKEYAEKFIKQYFRRADIDISIGKSDDFIANLWLQWQKRIGEGV